jgi:myotubularin-related protein 1/2
MYAQKKTCIVVSVRTVSLVGIVLGPSLTWRSLGGVCGVFQVLVEKDFIHFGHPFQLRFGHGQDRSARVEEQLSPIFLQFLDCVWQLLNQHPWLFEFNSRYLSCIAQHSYDCRFGTFLCNTVREKEAQDLAGQSVSLWTYMELNRVQFLNPVYGREGSPSPAVGLLRTPLPCLLRRVTLWAEYHLR